MPSFSKLNAKEFAELMTYVRNDLGNKVGDELQPSQTALPDDDE